jgi:hypothetical protein
MKVWLLRALGTIGTASFASLFIFTWATPDWVERTARDFITAEVRNQVYTHIDGVGVANGSETLSRVAGALQRQNELVVRAARAELETAMHARVDEALSQIRDPACPCRPAIATLYEYASRPEVVSLNTISLAEAAGPRLTQLVQMKYLGVVAELKRDLRIFTATNALACLLLLLLSFSRPRAIDHLLVPGLLLATAVAVSAYLYLFEQNWFQTVVYADYLGFAYLAYLGIIFGLLLDIVLNRGKVVTVLGNSVLTVVGSALTLSPC